jgi:hypothetical protein
MLWSRSCFAFTYTPRLAYKLLLANYAGGRSLAPGDKTTNRSRCASRTVALKVARSPLAFKGLRASRQITVPDQRIRLRVLDPGSWILIRGPWTLNLLILASKQEKPAPRGERYDNNVHQWLLSYGELTPLASSRIISNQDSRTLTSGIGNYKLYPTALCKRITYFRERAYCERQTMIVLQDIGIGI